MFDSTHWDHSERDESCIIWIEFLLDILYYNSYAKRSQLLWLYMRVFCIHINS